MKENKNRIRLSDHFTAGRMLRFTISSICMMVFSAVYGVVDGYFVSNYAGAVPFASLNLVMPFIMILSAVGFMVGTGGTALVSMYLGMGRKRKANETFSLLTYLLAAAGVVLGILGFAAADVMSEIMGATDEMLPYAVLYIRVNMIGIPFFMLQNMFQSFMIAAEKPKMGLAVTALAGCTNMVLDALFVGAFGFGLGGAAAATVISQVIGGMVPMVYFFLPNSSTLRLGKTHMDGSAVIKACSNGASEFLSNASTSIVGMLYNLQLMKFLGADGVAAYGVIMYVNFIFVGIYFGYTIGLAPVIGYHYGAGNSRELKNLLRTSLRMILATSVILTAAAELTAPVLVRIFVGYDPDLTALTLFAFRVYVIALLFMGFNIFGSGFFTALNNGKVSAILSVLRSLVLQLISIFLLPMLLGPNGLWGVVIFSDGICLFVTFYMLIRHQKEYQY